MSGARATRLRFALDGPATVHGFAGYFDAELYGEGADAAAVLWAGSSKKASLTDVARALDVRSSRGPAIGRDVDLAIRALLRRTRSKAGKKDA